MSAPRVSVYLLCRDRLDYFREAIESILGQSYLDFELIVSDNSEGDEVGHYVASTYPNLKYLRRRPPLGPIDHLTRILDEVESEYLVMFHDDDVLLPEYLNRMVCTLDAYPNTAAVGCNAFIIFGSKHSKALFAPGLCASVTIQTPEELFSHYVNLKDICHAPFPCYLYRMSIVRGVHPNEEEGGKHADVSFLMNVLKAGQIRWIPDVLMQYRRHAGNGSNEENIEEQLSLLRFALLNTKLTKKDIVIDDFRFVFWARWLLPKLDLVAYFCSRRIRIVTKFVLSRALSMLIIRPKVLGAKMARKLAVRLHIKWV